jgi:serine/threonine protein kinase
MPTPTTAISFLDMLVKSTLLSQEQVDQFFGTEAPADATQCATLLVKAELITQYQAKQLLAGKFRGFFLGPYKILRSIGQGGMGVVYLAEHMNLQRKVAVKVLTAEKAKDKLTLERFNREARAAAALDHPNIVHLHDISQGAGVHFLVMEYVDGNDLQSLMSQTGPLHYAQACQYVAQAAAGLQHAHDKGFIHRDIKPANLILTKDGRIKILDMGLARSFTDASDNLTGLLAEGDIAGTIDFLSPEQAMNNPLDERSDLYSLGATFYSLVTGHPPFNGTTAQKLMQHQLKEPPSLSIKLRGRVPDALSNVISKMMAKRPSERFQSAQDVIDAMGPWLPALSTGSIVQDQFNTVTQTPSPKSRSSTRPLRITKNSVAGGLPDTKPIWMRLPVVIGAATALVVLLATASWYFSFFGGKTRDAKPEIARSTSNTIPVPDQTQLAQPPVAVTTILPSQNSLYRFDFSTARDFKQTVNDGKTYVGNRDTGADLPEGMSINHWSNSSSAEYFVSNYLGSRAFGMRPINGLKGIQAHFRCSEILSNLKPQHSVTIRVEYALSGQAPAIALVEQRVETYPRFSETVIMPTGGQWKSIEIQFIRPESESGNYELTFRMDEKQAQTLETLWIKAIEIVSASKAQPNIEVAKASPLYQLDLSQQKSFTDRGHVVVSPKGAYQWVSAAKSGAGLPTGWEAYPWSLQDEAEYFADSIDGRMAIGARTIRGVGSAMMLTPKIEGFTSRVRLTVIYRTEQESTAKVSLRFVQLKPTSSPAYDLRMLSLTNGEWKTMTWDTELKGANAGVFEFHNLGTGSNSDFRIAGFEVARLEQIGAAAKQQDIFRLAANDIPLFKNTKTGFILTSGEQPNLGTGVSFAAHNPATQAEFACREMDGQRELCWANIGGSSTAQLALELQGNDQSLQLPLISKEKYRATVTYQTNGTPICVMYLQQKHTFKEVVGTKTNLADTGGTWKTATFTWVQPEQNLRMLVDNRSHGPTKTLHIRDLTITRVESGSEQQEAAPAVAPPAPPMAAGVRIYSYNFSTSSPFKKKFQDGESDDGKPYCSLAHMIYGTCWKKESVAEFVTEQVENRSAFGVTNLNDSVSSHIGFTLSAANMKPGKVYLARIEYCTRNDAYGDFSIQSDPNHNRIVIKKLEPTNGKWAALEVPFEVGSTNLNAICENLSVGEGNTLFIRKMEILEAK